MKFEITDVNIEALTSEAILQSLTQEKRDLLIKEAIRHILTPSQESWDKGKTPIQSAFNRQMELQVLKFIEKEFENNKQVEQQIKDLFNLAMEKAFTEQGKDSLVKIIGDAMSRFFKNIY